MKHTVQDHMVIGHEADLKALYACVDDFADKMKQKLKQKQSEGKRGWDDPEWPHEDRIAALEQHVEKGDMVDVSNFAMFVWNNQDD